VAETYRRVVQKEKLLSKVVLKTEYFSVCEVYTNATGCLDIILYEYTCTAYAGKWITRAKESAALCITERV
jgi:hypothetical protein